MGEKNGKWEGHENGMSGGQEQVKAKVEINKME